MSLWFESFTSTLMEIDQYYGVNPKADITIQEQQAKCILAYLSMDVPRHWWESALQIGTIDDSHAKIIQDVLKELHKLPELNGRIDPALLVAISFIDDLDDNISAKYGNYHSQHSLNDYLERGQRVLQEHPELYKVGNMIKMNLEGYLEEKEKELMDILMSPELNWNLVSEDDLKAKHYSLIDKDIPSGYGVSTEWSLPGLKQGKGTPSFDLVVVEKWSQEETGKWRLKKDCYKSIKPYYAVEYKVDDSVDSISNKQGDSFREQIIRLDRQCGKYLKRAFALYLYRGKSSWEKNPFNDGLEDYIFSKVNLANPDKLHVYYIGNRHKIRKLTFK